MANQPFEPSNFPHGERQLDVARSHVQGIQADYKGKLSDHVTSQLKNLSDSLETALEADTADQRVAAIETAREQATTLRGDPAFNPTLSAGIQRRVCRMLDIAEETVENAT